jgi:hypothetical protein
VGETSRVLTADGAFVATAVCNDNLQEVWELIGVDDPREPLKFTHDNGEAVLAAHFASIDRRDVVGELVFPDTESIRGLVASTIDRAHLAPRVPEIAAPLHATTRHVVFVAREPR